jgi:hypothetical protein
MSIDLALPPEGAAYDDRGDVLRVGIGHGGPLELRVDDGLVFGRFFSQEPGTWTDVSVSSVIALFAANTPMRQLLLASLTDAVDPVDDTA